MVFLNDFVVVFVLVFDEGGNEGTVSTLKPEIRSRSAFEWKIYTRIHVSFFDEWLYTRKVSRKKGESKD